MRFHPIRFLVRGPHSLYALMLLALGLFGTACDKAKSDPQAEAPPPLKVERVEDRNVFQAAHPEAFQMAEAVEHSSVAQLRVTGVVTPDISRAVPVISLASGRVVEIKARLGDTVQKDQVLLRVQSADISGAYSDHLKAKADEELARVQLERSKLLYEKGAISRNNLEIAENVENKAKVDVETTAEHLRVLGSPNLDQPSGVVDIHAPISGIITDQQVTNAAGVQSLASPNPFTITDISYVWIVCDVFENDMAALHLGDQAEVRLNAYPDKPLTGTISNIGAVLDPTIRTAKVRIEVRNPGTMRPGMFATAIFHGGKKETRAAVPATAILHLHDREWVYVPLEGHAKQFRRVEVTSGEMLPGNMQEVVSGIKPGQRVVANALEFQNTVESQ